MWGDRPVRGATAGRSYGTGMRTPTASVVSRKFLR